MNGLIGLKEEEGYKQISKGEVYMVLSNACKPSSSVSLTNNEDKRFNFEDAKTTTSNFAIDCNILMKNPPDPLVFIKMPSSKIIKTSVLLNVAYNGIPFWLPLIFNMNTPFYQNVLVYAFIFPKTSPDHIIELINEYNPGVTFDYIPTLNACVMFVPLNHNDPFTLRYEDHI
ncbi:hypothetical protein ACTFIV_000101 [Dictyostelium citrinum]